MKRLVLRLAVLVGAAVIATSFLFTAPRPASADEETTAVIAIGAAAIVGALLYDANRQPYYIRGGRRCYVSAPVATYYYREHEPRGYYAREGYYVRDWHREHAYDDRREGRDERGWRGGGWSHGWNR